MEAVAHMSRTIDEIRTAWSDPTHCLRESDEQDVRTLLSALNEAEAAADRARRDYDRVLALAAQAHHSAKNAAEWLKPAYDLYMHKRAMEVPKFVTLDDGQVLELKEKP